MNTTTSNSIGNLNFSEVMNVRLSVPPVFRNVLKLKKNNVDCMSSTNNIRVVGD